MSLALICGAGALPATIARAQQMPPLVCALSGFEPEDLTIDLTFRLEHLGSLLAELRKREVSQICLCGAIKRPQLDPGALDDATKPLVPTLMQAMAQGDDGALRAVIAVFEQSGFEVLGTGALAPDLLLSAGIPTVLAPTRQARADAQSAISSLAEMGRRDLGQSCVIRLRQVLSLEDDAGTDAMLDRLHRAGAQNPGSSDILTEVETVMTGALDGVADWLTNAPEERPYGGIFFKAPKPGQDRRADLPTIGPSTVRKVAEAGLSGLVIEAGGVIVLQRSSVIKTANELGLFLWARTP